MNEEVQKKAPVVEGDATAAVPAVIPSSVSGPSDEGKDLPSSVSGPSDEGKDEDDKRTDMEKILERLNALEKENKLLKEERDDKKKTYFSYAAKDLYDSLNDLQVSLRDRVRLNVQEARDRATDSMSSGMVHFDKMKFDIQPWVEAAARSRNIDPAIILAAIPKKKRQLSAAVVTFLLLPTCLFSTVVWLLLALFVDKSRLMLSLFVLYAVHMYFDRAHEHGSKPSAWVRGNIFWKYLCNYFPCLLIKQNPDTVFDPEGIYMFGYHPHGIISIGCFVNFGTAATGCEQMFPGIKIRPATLEMNFFIPFWRELLHRLGAISVSAESIQNVLNKGPGNAVLIVPGGASESLDSKPGTHSLTLNKRQGFFRIALQNGAFLVPIYSFGENDLYEQAPNDVGSPLRRFQNLLLKNLGFAMPFFSGAGSSGVALPMNPIPSRVPIITIVGDPIPCPLIENPTQEDIQAIKVKYIEKLQEIFTQFADVYAPTRKQDLEILK
jgi:2-acylglycerol O-acyltransferase 2